MFGTGYTDNIDLLIVSIFTLIVIISLIVAVIVSFKKHKEQDKKLKDAWNSNAEYMGKDYIMK